MFNDDEALTRGKKRAKKSVEKSVKLLDEKASPAVRQEAMKHLTDAFLEALRLADWKDRRTIIDAVVAWINAASEADDESLADDMPF